MTRGKENQGLDEGVVKGGQGDWDIYNSVNNKNKVKKQQHPKSLKKKLKKRTNQFTNLKVRII